MKIDYSITRFSPDQSEIQTDTYTYWIIFRGSGIITADGTDFPFQSHDFFEFPADTEIQLQNTSEVEIGSIRLKDFEATNKKVRFTSGEYTEWIRRVFYLAYDYQGSVIANDIPDIRDSILNALYNLTAQSLFAISISKNMVLNPVINAVIADILQNYKDPSYDLITVIARTGYSLSHFRKLFREQTGTSPNHFLFLKRLDYSCDLMQHSKTISIQDVALQSGFSDPLYFSRLFKKYKGVSPREYQKNPTENL